MIDEIYKIITEVWQFAKKYIANADKNASDEYWQRLMTDCDALYKKTRAMDDDDIRIFAEDMTKAVVRLLERLTERSKTNGNK